ncbi:MAG: hypothetical protein GC164_05735 [Phycisphaera sp.]|nr:hypothetical protein [Phycisphaera sp.]
MRSLFKFLIGFSALFIAGCSAYFSVKGLGTLFAGSAAAVMVMAASLELGKLLAASFLYRYWEKITFLLRVYLTLAVFVLMGITSLGIYGYLARAYEQTHSTIVLLEQKIDTVAQQNKDTQRQIDALLDESTRTVETDRTDLDKEQQQLTAVNRLLDESLARLSERRDGARTRRDKDIADLQAVVGNLDADFQKNVELEQQAITDANTQLTALDRAVDAYTAEGGAGFLKADSIKIGQKLREQQKPERDALALTIQKHRDAIEALRSKRDKDQSAIQARTESIDAEYKQRLAGFDTEEQKLRDDHAAATAAVQARLTALRSANRSSGDDRDKRVASLYQRLRSGQDEIAHIQAQIAGTDIGSYRFVARAMNAPVDDVVKWLILIFVLVFDPLAVALTVGFNIAMMADKPGTRKGSGNRGDGHDEKTADGEGPRGQPAWVPAGIGVMVLALLVAGGWYAAQGYLARERTHRHAQWVPTNSFAVLTLNRSGGQDALEAMCRRVRLPFSKQLTALLSDGFDKDADVYAFMAYPQSQADNATQPVVLVGLVAAVSDPSTAERSLARFVETSTGSLIPRQQAGLDRSRAMIRSGEGRYLDPEGGFFSFALTDDAAVLMVELEGDPMHPVIEDEMQRLLTRHTAVAGSMGSGVLGEQSQGLPARATVGDGAIRLWFDAQRCFEMMPKNPQAQARYDQLQRFLNFDLVVKAEPTPAHALSVTGRYTYAVDRFATGSAKGRDSAPTLLTTLGALGPVAEAGTPGLLMDRCADTLDFDALIARLRSALTRASGGATSDAVDKTGSANTHDPLTEVVVDQVVESNREARFSLVARFGETVDSPLDAALERLAPPLAR